VGKSYCVPNFQFFGIIE